MLTFVKRPRRDQTIAADRKLWTSRCRQYRVAFSRCHYGPRDERGLWTCGALNTSTRSLEYGMCCRDIEAETPPKSLSATPPYGELSEAAQASSISPSG